jgi:uncharacterized Tic20 family protein
MSNTKKLTGKDYAWWTISVLALFVLFLWVGNFGNLAYLTQSPITNYVETLWHVTYIAAGGVFAIFMGSIIFLSVRFRAVEVTEAKPKNVINYYYAALFIDLLAVIGITYEIFTIAISQFILGLLAAADLLLFASIIYLVYKMYYQE